MWACYKGTVRSKNKSSAGGKKKRHTHLHKIKILRPNIRNRPILLADCEI